MRCGNKMIHMLFLLPVAVGDGAVHVDAACIVVA